MSKRKDSLVSVIKEVNGHEIHILSRKDGKVVTEYQVQKYVRDLADKKNYRQIEANKKSAEQKKRLDDYYKQNRSKDKKIPGHLYKEFLFDIVNGIPFCSRKYKMTEENIVQEIKRIAPHININTIR